MRNKKLELITKRLVLKSIEDSDKNEFIAILNDPCIKKTYMLPDLNNKDEEDKLFNKLKDVSHSDKRIVYGIYLKDRIIGFINDVAIENDEVEIGYFISSKEWNKGYASEAFEAVIKEVFDMGYHRVVAAFFEGNIASEKVMQKCGMKLAKKEETILYRGQNLKAIYYLIEDK